MPYVPGKLPTLKDPDAQALAQYFEDELVALASSLIQNIQVVDLSPSTVAPLRPRTGVVVYADGAHFNPGGGEGAYVYGSDAAWHFLNNVAPKNFSVVFQKFTASGTYTPTPGMAFCFIECQAGGGAGGGAALTAASTQNGGSGGGGGEYARKLATAAAIGVSQVVTIGPAGVAATPPTTPTAGGTTSVGSLCIAIGGPAGINAPNSGNGTSVPGGTGGTGDFKVPGGASSQGFPNNFASAFPPVGGCGGNSVFGQGGPMISTAQSGLPGSGFGAGGGGASDNGAGNRPGGAGTIGIVFITEFIFV